MNKIKIDINNYQNYTFDFNDWETYKKYEFSEQVLEKHQDKWDWDWIAIDQTLTEPFIEKFKDKWNDWDCIAINQSLTESFIEKYQDKFKNWNYIAGYQTLTESFIEKFKDKWNWNYIAMNQSLTESFIEKFKDKWNWYRIAKDQTLSEFFRNKYLNEYQKKLYKEFHKNEILKDTPTSTSLNKSNKHNSHCYKCGSQTIIWDIGFGNSNQRICPKCKE